MDSAELLTGGDAEAPSSASSAPAAQEAAAVNLPGDNACAYAMLPLRLALVLILFGIAYPLLTLVAVLRAIYLRCVHGKPSQILK